MQTFEVHITGDQSIIQAAEKMGIKAITINLLRKDKSVLRQEFMTSQVYKFENYLECKKHIDEVVHYLENDHKVDIIRVKIESPFYEEYRESSLYMESHFQAENDSFPMSQNVRKTSILATDRTYNQEEYDAFREKYKNVELELALYDTFIEEDKDWFEFYK